MTRSPSSDGPDSRETTISEMDLSTDATNDDEADGSVEEKGRL